MIGELIDVFWRHKVNALRAALNVTDFKDLCVVTKHIRCHLEWRHVDDIDIRVFRCENSADLGIFSL